ncbi:glycerophosphoryl diester phosphodiesterase [Vibrio sp. SS-MA-C1-2]|uniref:glycerophosphodiester phosphodiesterase n=1 Tax=Vibrio sp. SS-MA-C1-2 TaxID=2908646 RepID=UPI001F424B4A|nr:glycerophosphodiester phosphodiesterase family protein [Vibrio sp. SS-MA-C1-2]UJF17875.1 glycerophosphoryl diester phosphodiesterase [Vibrio sp. SS-MA-C1-2]
MKVTAHRGASGYAPENTLSSIKKAAELGADGVEFDIQLTKDAVPIVFHDKTVDRCTNGCGEVFSLTLNEIKKLDAGLWFSDDYEKEQIPTLEEVLVLCNKLGLKVNIENKSYITENTPLLVDRLFDVIKDTDFNEENVLISSFSYEILNLCQNKNPNIKLGYITETWTQKIKNNINNLNLFSININYLNVSSDIALDIKESDYQLQVWTLNDINKLNELEQWNVDTVITDKPDLFI